MSDIGRSYCLAKPCTESCSLTSGEVPSSKHILNRNYIFKGSIFPLLCHCYVGLWECKGAFIICFKTKLSQLCSQSGTSNLDRIFCQTTLQPKTYIQTDSEYTTIVIYSLGGGFKRFLFSPLLGGKDPIWLLFFSTGLKPPTISAAIHVDYIYIIFIVCSFWFLNLYRWLASNMLQDLAIQSLARNLSLDAAVTQHWLGTFVVCGAQVIQWTLKDNYCWWKKSCSSW